MASFTKDSFRDVGNKEESSKELAAGVQTFAPSGTTTNTKVSSSRGTDFPNQVSPPQKAQTTVVPELGSNFSTDKKTVKEERNNSGYTDKGLIDANSVTATPDILDSSPIHIEKTSKNFKLPRESEVETVVPAKAEVAASDNTNKTQVANVENERQDEKTQDKAPLLTKEEFDDLVRRCCFLAIYSNAKVPKVRYKRLEESVLTICRLFYTRRHKIDWFVEELNRSEGHDWTASQWVEFLRGSNFKMVKLKAYKGIGNFCYYNGSVFTTAGILGSCQCLREVRSGVGGKQGNRDILPDEELKSLYESEEIVKVDPNAFPDESEIAPLKPVRPRMTLKRQSDSIAQNYSLENSSFRNPKISYSLSIGETAAESPSKTGSSPVETDSDVEVEEMEASEQEREMESTESSESNRHTSRKRVRESLEMSDANITSETVAGRNKSTFSWKEAKHSGGISDKSHESMDEYLNSALAKFSVQIHEKLDRSIHNIENQIELISQRVSKIEEKLERQISFNTLK